MDPAENAERPLVLIIDDDEQARDLYGHWFAAHGVQVACAVGTFGLSWAMKRLRPELIVSEVRARDLTVTDLLAALRSLERTCSIPVLVLTTCTDARTLNSAVDAGAAAVLPKWVDFGVLASWVDALCR